MHAASQFQHYLIKIDWNKQMFTVNHANRMTQRVRPYDLKRNGLMTKMT